MSALAEALVAAQRRALAQLEKGYVRGPQEDRDVAMQGFRDALAAIGLADREDVETLIACLEVIRQTGGSVPAEPASSAPQKAEPATQAQRDRIKRDLVPRHGDDAALSISSEPSLTKAQASEIIDSIAKGTFELEKWAVPF